MLFNFFCTIMPNVFILSFIQPEVVMEVMTKNVLLALHIT